MIALRRFAALPAGRRRALLQAVAVTAAVRLALLALPFSWVLRFVDRLGARSAGRDSLTVDDLAWSVAAASRRIRGASCLTQALALRTLLGRNGHASQLHIGVARGEGARLSAHAWVESGGRVVIGGEGRSEFVPLPPWEGSHVAPRAPSS